MHRQPPIQSSARTYAPHRPSLLSSSPSYSASTGHPPLPHLPSDTPSSPTTSSFYRAPLASTSSAARPTGRAYKSRASSRKASLVPPSSSPSAGPSISTSTSTSARLFALSASHAARVRSLASTRSTSLSAFSSGLADEPGGWTGTGEWEEFTAEEQAELEVEMLKARREFRWEMRRREEEAEENGFLDVQAGDDAMEGQEEEEEPPLDLLYDDLDPSLLSLPSPSLIPPRLPSLTSDAGSGPPSTCSSIAGGGDSDMDDDWGESLDRDSAFSAAGPAEPTDEALRAFDGALLGAPCPACGVTGRTVQPDSAGGARCSSPSSAGGGEEAGCGWAIPGEVMHPLRRAFASHSSTSLHSAAHLPLLHHTPFTGTLVLCSAPGCEEQFAA
ncbi:hypothetical protein JCM11251_002847 [Rhodosporidiobolus azoricus]